MEQNKNHSVKIESGQGFFATAIAEVLSFNEKEIRLAIFGGGRLIVLGENLKISGFNNQLGELKVSGKVLSLKYLSAVISPVKRLFK